MYEEERLPELKRVPSDDLLRELMRPDRYFRTDGRGVNASMSKELKVANITRKEAEELLDISDIAAQWDALGAKNFADFMGDIRDTKLALSSSIDGFHMRTMATQIHEHQLKENKGTLSDIFRRKRE